MAGLTGSRVTPQACLRAARKAGLSGRIAFRPVLEDIPSLVLPCILLLTKDRSCALTALRGDTAEVIFPEISDSAQSVPLAALKEEYSGYALFAAVQAAPDERAEKLTLSKGKRWFWDVLRYYAPIYRHVALASVVINLIAVASPLFVMNVYDRVVPNNATETLWVLAMGILIIYLFNFLLSSLRTHFVDVAGRNADIVLSSSLVDKVLSMRLDAKPESTGAMVNNLREFEQLREFFSSSSLLACIDLPFLVIFLLLIGLSAARWSSCPSRPSPFCWAWACFCNTAPADAPKPATSRTCRKTPCWWKLWAAWKPSSSAWRKARMQRLWESVVGLSAKSTSEARKYNNLAITASMLITQIVTAGHDRLRVRVPDHRRPDDHGRAHRLQHSGAGAGPWLRCSRWLRRSTRMQNSHVTLKALDMLMELPSENQAERTCNWISADAAAFLHRLENVSFA